MSTTLFASPETAFQPGFEFPKPLTEKYQPRSFADFVGLEKPRKVMANLAAKPRQASFIFRGPSGTGKTTLALALVAQMPAELHHIPAKECDLATVKSICDLCWTIPQVNWQPVPMHIVIVDEADRMTEGAQLAFLSKLDVTDRPPNTIFIFTCNATANLEDRFISRCQVLEFSSYGIAADAAKLLERVWFAEAPEGAQAPNFNRLVKDASNNLRSALGALETELMAI